jgi:MoxR-like ATPase
VLSYEALSDGQTADALIARVMKAVPLPQKPLETHVRVAAGG